ncbi:uncharacterized protein PHACADRAFT_93087 [Phanerochaete carnosa HHB-10118-sp]|uniref:Autophagy-related protein 14 n=1 Tax=Phanerochaete carnosa (strain HHB-10118-sp) TaxID=650164 RepID=K5X0H1_PHACS|nr:uncharacterized protein PHACADRAFT_93087 [Phanerochaete carnosa HHB-10118-sp]EKM56262.1 hypothetical protein PHACADRAFT_93087 [Phanerochaete carnosa HHB-10118-sp]
MECQNCELKQRQFCCENCLKQHLQSFRHQISQIAAERDAYIASAQRSLITVVNSQRIRRADIKGGEERVREIWDGLSALRKANEKTRERLRSLREDLANRRRTLAAANTLFTQEPSSVELNRQIEEATYQLTSLSDTIARARSGLVQELVEVFSVVEVGGRPPIGGKAGTKGEWTIGGLVLPVPGDMRRYPPDHINAVLTHTLHFLSLLGFYLGSKLPFEVVWSRSSTPPTSSQIAAAAPPNLRGNGLLGVGTPWIGATKGSEYGGWAKWSTKHPLHVSMSPPPASGSSSPMTSSPPGSLRPLEADSASAHGSSFTTALAMLLYNVCYLAHTQAVDVPLAQAGEVLGNLWAVCCSPELGRRSHATHPRLPPPTPPNFQLEFAQLLQATAANPSRARARTMAGNPKRKVREEYDPIVEEEDWDMVDDVSG